MTADPDRIPPTAGLVAEVLAARYRLGEPWWTFDRGTKRALTWLQDAGWVNYQPGILPGTWRASLTTTGLDMFLSSGYAPPSPLGDLRVHPDQYVVYPTNYDTLPMVDKDAWCLTVMNGHAWGWSIRRGMASTSDFALTRDGRWVVESRGDNSNRSRRWPLDEALRIALDHVDTVRTYGGMSVHEMAEWMRKQKDAG